MISGKFKFAGLVFVTVVMLGGLYYASKLTSQNTEQRAKATVNAGPITGTFFLSDIALTFSQMEEMVDEWKGMGMDTVITLASGSLKRKDGNYTEDDYFAHDSVVRDMVKIATARKMKVIVGPVSIDEGVNVNPTFREGDNYVNDRIRAVDFSKRLAISIKSYCQNNGIPWELISGFYLTPEVPIGGDITYHNQIAQAFKSVAPEKLTVLAPYLGESEDFNESETYRYINNFGKLVFHNSAIDILAVQDSLGTGKVSRLVVAKTAYRALNDALVGAPTGKAVWADIETFEKPVGASEYYPASFSRVVQQIETWKPYVSKNINWLYQHDMQLNPSVFNSAGRTWNPEYTYSTVNAAKRAALRKAYIDYYGIVPSTGGGTVVYPTLVASEPKFYDVPTNNFAFAAIEKVSAKNIMSGCGTNKFCPDVPLTRAEAAVVLLKAVHGGNMSPTKAVEARFSDVPMGYWAIDWINQAADEGIFTGAGGTFRPSAPLTRAEAAVVFLVAFYGNPYSPPAASGVFGDVPTSHWASKWVEQLSRDGFTSGCGGGNYCPDGQLTRAQAAIMLAKIIDSKNVVIPTSVVPTEVPTAKPTKKPTNVPTIVKLVNGACFPTHYNCSEGLIGDFLEYNDQWQWWCMGTGGGVKVLCSELKPTQIPSRVPTSIPTVVSTVVPTAAPTGVINIPTQPLATATKKPTSTVKPTSPVVSGERILGDSTGDGVVDVMDYAQCYREMIESKGKVKGNWSCDFTGINGVPDGVVDTYDYSIWYQEFNKSL